MSLFLKSTSDCEVDIWRDDRHNLYVKSDDAIAHNGAILRKDGRYIKCRFYDVYDYDFTYIFGDVVPDEDSETGICAMCIQKESNGNPIIDKDYWFSF